jgi:hypothetical protein
MQSASRAKHAGKHLRNLVVLATLLIPVSAAAQRPSVSELQNDVATLEGSVCSLHDQLPETAPLRPQFCSAACNCLDARGIPITSVTSCDETVPGTFVAVFEEVTPAPNCVEFGPDLVSACEDSTATSCLTSDPDACPRPDEACICTDLIVVSGIPSCLQSECLRNAGLACSTASDCSAPVTLTLDPVVGPGDPNPVSCGVDTTLDESREWTVDVNSNDAAACLTAIEAVGGPCTTLP